MNSDIIGDLPEVVNNVSTNLPSVHTLGRREDLTGRTYGRLTVVSPAPSYKWVCKCSCGVSKVIRAGHLLEGGTLSCGCLIREKTSERARSHGFSKHTLYPIWKQMIARCCNPSNPHYYNYGERGITVETRWLNVENFIEDMEPTYQRGLSIDRTDNDKGYSKENCRWATREEQNRNQRSNRAITYNGETRILVEWCELLKLGYKVTQRRLGLGWSIEDTFERPLRGHPTKQ